MMQNQDKTKILNKLKLLRQQSINDYVIKNLSAIDNKQVISDILNQFLSSNEQQFLTNITTSICEIKEEYRKVKKELKEKEDQQKVLKLKIQNQLAEKYEKQMEKFFQKWLEVEEVCEEKCGQRNPVKAVVKLTDQVSQITKKLQHQQTSFSILSQTNQSLQTQLSSLKSHLTSVQHHLSLLNQKLSSKDLLNKSLEEQVYQKHIKLEQTMINLEQVRIKNVNLQEMMKFLENKACGLREENVKLKNQKEFILQDKEEKIKEIQKLNKCLNMKEYENEGLVNQIDKMKELLEEEKKKILRLNNQIQVYKTKQMPQIVNKLQTLQSTNKNLLSQIQLLSNQLTQKTQTISTLQSTLQATQQQFVSTQTKLSQKDSIMKKYLNNKDQQIKLIQQQLKQLKLELLEKQDQQKQYQLYLQEIIQLKEKIKTLKPSKYQDEVEINHLGQPTKLIKNKKTKFYFLLTQVKNKLQRYREEKMEVVKWVGKQILVMKEYVSKVVQIIGNKMVETKLICQYCDHNYERDQINITNQTNNNKFSSTINQKPQIYTKIDYQVSNTPINQLKYGKILKSKNNLSQNNQDSRSQIHQQFQKTKLFSEVSAHKLIPSRQFTSTNYENPNKPQSKPFYNNLNPNPTPTSHLNKKLQKINSKMKALNQQNLSYQIHLSRVLSQQQQQNPCQL